MFIVILSVMVWVFPEDEAIIWTGTDTIRNGMGVSILMTIQEFYYGKWKESLPQHILYDTAYIISWNIWQMGGLTKCIPQENIVKDKDKNYVAIDSIRVKIMNWKEHKAEVFGE